MANAMGQVTSLSSIILCEETGLLWFDLVTLMIQTRLPLLLATLALIRDTFDDMSVTSCYVTNYTDNKDFVNAYCKYRENIGLLGYHEFIPFTFTLQTVLMQLPALAWIFFGGKKMSMVAKWFCKCCRDYCSRQDQVCTPQEKKSDVCDSIASEKFPDSIHSIIHSYINKWSTSCRFTVGYATFSVMHLVVTGVSFGVHLVMLIVTIRPNFFNHEFECYVETVDKIFTCVKPYEIFNQILLLINLVICLALPLILMIIRDFYLLFRRCKNTETIANFLPCITKPQDRFNDTNILLMYYKEIIDLDEKYVQKILITNKPKTRDNTTADNSRQENYELNQIPSPQYEEVVQE